MKPIVPLTLVAAATLAACAAYEPVTPAPQAAAVVTTHPVVVAPAPAAPGSVTVAPSNGTTAGAVVAPGTVVGTAVTLPPLRPGLGRVDSISPVPSTGTGGNVATMQNRLAVRMDDGTMQYLDTRAAPAVGERVEITSNGQIGWPVPQSR